MVKQVTMKLSALLFQFLKLAAALKMKGTVGKMSFPHFLGDIKEK